MVSTKTELAACLSGEAVRSFHQRAGAAGSVARRGWPASGEPASPPPAEWGRSPFRLSREAETYAATKNLLPAVWLPLTFYITVWKTHPLANKVETSWSFLKRACNLFIQLVLGCCGGEGRRPPVRLKVCEGFRLDSQTFPSVESNNGESKTVFSRRPWESRVGSAEMLSSTRS